MRCPYRTYISRVGTAHNSPEIHFRVMGYFIDSESIRITEVAQVDAASSKEPGIWAAAAEFQAGDDLIISVLSEKGRSLDILILNPETKKIIAFGKSTGNIGAVLLSDLQYCF